VLVVLPYPVKSVFLSNGQYAVLFNKTVKLCHLHLENFCQQLGITVCEVTVGTVVGIIFTVVGVVFASVLTYVLRSRCVV